MEQSQYLRKSFDLTRTGRVVMPQTGAGVSVQSKFLCVDGEKFWAKGVTYGSFLPNEEGDPFPPIWQVKDDFLRMAEAGINTVRLYGPATDRVADAVDGTVQRTAEGLGPHPSALPTGSRGSWL